MDTTRSQITLPEPRPRAERIAPFLRRLRAGGATELRAAHDHIWIIGRAPSGVLFELLAWPQHGYCVSRRIMAPASLDVLGVFPAWTEAVDQALRA